MSPIVLGRDCGSCTLCCKVLKIQALEKPQGQWCQHCTVGSGCQIYAEKPTECTNFYCGYLTIENLGEEWKPNHSKLVLVSELEGNRVVAYADPSRPDAWRREPYYSTLKQWAVAAAPHRGQVMAAVGQRMYMILPDKDVDLGIVTDDDRLVTGERRTPAGIVLEAYKIHKDHPRAQKLAPQKWAQITKSGSKDGSD